MQQQIEPAVLPQYQRILYATDGSAAALRAGRHAIFLAQHSRAQLVVLYTVPHSVTHRISFLLGRIVGEERRLARKAVEEIVQLARASGVEAIPVTEQGWGSEAIGRAATRFDVDLVVVTSSGGALEKIFRPGRPDSQPLWAARPVCVIMSSEEVHDEYGCPQP